MFTKLQEVCHEEGLLFADLPLSLKGLLMGAYIEGVKAAKQIVDEPEDIDDHDCKASPEHGCIEGCPNMREDIYDDAMDDAREQAEQMKDYLNNEE